MKTTVKAALAVAFILSSAAVAAQQVTLKVAHFLPAVAHGQVGVLQPWCEAMKRDSGGRIVCQFYPSLQLGGTPANLVDQVKNRIADVVWTAPGYSNGRFRAIEAFELPFMVTGSTSGSAALWKYYLQHATEEFKDYKVLAFYVEGGQAIHTSNREIKGADDLRGLKLRTSTRLGAKAVMALGGMPVAMPPAQVTEAISKGVVDGALAGWGLVAETKLDEVTGFHAQPRLGQPYLSATVLMVLMNKQRYDSLPPDLKAVVDKHSGEALVARFGRVFDEEIEKVRAHVLKQGGVVNDIPSDELMKMKQKTNTVEAEWIKEVTAKGLNGAALAAAAHQIAEGQ